MGKKKGKKDKKVSGAEKTALKTEKKADKRAKKELRQKGEVGLSTVQAFYVCVRFRHCISGRGRGPGVVMYFSSS